MVDSLESARAYQKAHLGDDRKAEIIAPTVIFLAIAYTAVFFRYKSRRVARMKLGTEYAIQEAISPLLEEFLRTKTCT